MAKAINPDIVYSRGVTSVACKPEDVIVKPEENGRAFGLDPERIKELAFLMLRDGQQNTPGTVRRIEGNRLLLTAGNYRHAAVEYINANGLSGDKPWLFRAEVEDLNAEEAFLRNISENRDRTKTTAIDDAHNTRRLEKQFSWTEPLLELAKEEGKGKITETSVLKAARKTGALKKTTGLKMPEVSTAFRYVADDEKAPPKARKFAKAFLDYRAGTLVEPDFLKLMKRLLAD